jgi:hypothetical protein
MQSKYVFRGKWIVGGLIAWCGLAGIVHADAMARLKTNQLRATRADVEALAAQRKDVELESGYQDVRTSMHVHSLFSHDSRSPLSEVVEGAKAAGVRVVMFNEHPAPSYDYFKDGHRGLHDGVLVMPGAETGGFLAYPSRSIQDEKTDGPQQFIDLVTRDDGLIFMSHLEERLDWDVHGMTGTEIYNTHADVKDEPKLLGAFRNPLGMMALLPAFQQFPQEAFAAMQDYPADYLRKFDALCQQERQTGVAANDSHHNTAVKAVVTEDGKLEVLGGVGERLTILDPEKVALVKGLIDKKNPGDVVFELDLDPYPRSLKHVSTHLLLPEVTEVAVHEALKQGRAYVAFGWMADSTGFVFQARQNDKTWPLGAEVPMSDELEFQAAAPLPGFFRLIKNGEEFRTEMGRTLTAKPDGPGVYRVEVWLNLAGERRLWILSNPIYVRDPS